MFDGLTLPPYDQVAHLEGLGNYAVKKYYKFPYRPFYRHKLKMAVSMIDKNEYYRNCLDFGAGRAEIFKPELQKHARLVKSVDKDDAINYSWDFDLIMCSSVLEFTFLDHTTRMLRKLINNQGHLIVASPMKTPISNLYFKLIKDEHRRNSHKEIMDSLTRYFKVEAYKEWLGLYFSARLSPK